HRRRFRPRTRRSGAVTDAHSHRTDDRERRGDRARDRMAQLADLAFTVAGDPWERRARGPAVRDPSAAGDQCDRTHDERLLATNAVHVSADGARPGRTVLSADRHWRIRSVPRNIVGGAVLSDHSARTRSREAATSRSSELNSL